MHHTQQAGGRGALGPGAVNNGTVIGWGLARSIFPHHRLVSRHPQGEMGYGRWKYQQHEQSILLHGWGYKHYFEFAERKENNLTKLNR